MFTADNSTFNQTERVVLNSALKMLLIGEPEGETRDQIERSYSDALNNEWRPGVLSIELVDAVKQRLGISISAIT